MSCFHGASFCSASGLLRIFDLRTSTTPATPPQVEEVKEEVVLAGEGTADVDEGEKDRVPSSMSPTDDPSGDDLSESGQSDPQSVNNTVNEVAETVESLKSENAALKELHLLQHQLLVTNQAQLKLLESDIENWRALYSYQDKLVSEMQAKLEEQVTEKRSLQDAMEKRRAQPEVQIQEGLQRNQWALDCLKGKLTEMQSELKDCQAEASNQVRATLATHVRSGWKAACMLPHELMYPMETAVSAVDKDEFCFVEWLFSRSLVRHRHAHVPDKWCQTPNVKILKVEKIKNRSFLKRYMLRREEVTLEQAGRGCPRIKDIKTRTEKKVTLRPFEEEVCPCPDSELNEVLLFHGTTQEKLTGILKSGFDPRLAGMGTGAMFGHGSYFAHNASKCFRYARQGPFIHNSGEGRKLRQTVLVVRALLGNPFYQSTMCPEKRLPPSGTDSMIALTRAEGGCVDHREYMLYDRSSTLPLYIVEFEHQEDCGCCVCTA